MEWILFVIILTFDGPQYEMLGTFDSMEDCFEQRELVVKELGKPIINYQAVCVAKSF